VNCKCSWTVLYNSVIVINDLHVNVKKTKAMYINCNNILNIEEKQAETVKEFKYLGLRLSNNSRKPECLL